MPLIILVMCLTSSNLRAQQAPATVGPAPLPSHYLNEELPQWVSFGGEIRFRLEGLTGGGFQPNNSDDYTLTRLRINLTVKPVVWLGLFVQGQDSHALWKNQPVAPPFQSRMHLRQAYVEMGDTTKGRIGLRVGRQELAFGAERLIGPSGWLNTPRYFEAARLTLRHRRYRLDTFVSSVIIVREGTQILPTTSMVSMEALTILFQTPPWNLISYGAFSATNAPS